MKPSGVDYRAIVDWEARVRRMNALADAACAFAGGWLPLSVRYGIAEKMLDGFDAWEAERGPAANYVTVPSVIDRGFAEYDARKP